MVRRRICWCLFTFGIVLTLGCNSILGIDDVPTPLASSADGGPGGNIGDGGAAGDAQTGAGQDGSSGDGGSLPTCSFDDTAHGFDNCSFAP